MPWHDQTPDERRATRTPRGPWWSAPARQTIDLATALFPALLHERLDEIGIDFGVVYPSLGLVFLHAADEGFRRGACRALNRCNAEIFAPLADRLTPVAAIPMHTPEEAVAELEYAVTRLGFKAVLCAGYVQRPIEALAGRDPEADALRLLARPVRHRLGPRLRPGLGDRPVNSASPSPSTPASSA